MKSKLNIMLGAMALFGWFSTSVFAVNGTWTNTINGLWSVPGNWGGGIVASGANFTASFADIAGVTVTQDAPNLTIGNLYFTNGNYNVRSNTITLSGGSAVTVGTNTSATISSILAGTETLSKLGTGVLTLTGSNTYSGGMSVGAGMLAVSNNNALGTGTLVMNGGMFSNGLSGATLTNTISFGTTAYMINTVTTTFSGPISGSGGLTLLTNQTTTAGKLILSGSNNFTGSVMMNNCGGLVVVQNSMALGSNKTIYVQGNAPGQTLVMDGTYGDLVLGSSIVFQSSWSAGNGAISNAAGNNVINGNFTMTAGGGATYLVAGAGTLTMNGSFTPNTTGRTLTLGGAAKGIINGPVYDGTTSNIMGLAKQETGTWILAGTNTYSVGTTVSGGKLAGATGGSSASSTVTVNNTSGTIGVLVTDNTRQWTCAGLVFSLAGRLDIDFGFTIKPSAVTAPLNVTNDLNFTATPVVTVSGSTNISAGTYPLMTWTTRSGAGAVPTMATLPPHVTGGNLTIIGSTLNVSITTNTQPLTWTNAASGVWDTSVFSWTDSAGTSAKYQETLAGGDTIIFDDTPGAGSSTASLNVVAMPAKIIINNTNRNYTISGSGRISGSASLIKSGAGNFTMNMPNDYTGVTTINAGTLTIGGNGTLYGGSGRGTITNNGSLVYNSTATQTLYDAVTGTGSVTCAGSGTLIFAVASSYTGSTRISGGMLQVNQPSLATAGDVYATSGGILNLNFSGTNTIGGLHINGASLPKGTYGATGSGAMTTRDDFLSGSGVLNVTVGAPGTVVIVQ